MARLLMTTADTQWDYSQVRGRLSFSHTTLLDATTTAMRAAMELHFDLRYYDTKD
jgi:hypothetical protein